MRLRSKIIAGTAIGLAATVASFQYISPRRISLDGVNYYVQRDMGEDKHETWVSWKTHSSHGGGDYTRLVDFNKDGDVDYREPIDSLCAPHVDYWSRDPLNPSDWKLFEEVISKTQN